MQHTVLVVEDDAAVLESLVRALGQDGCAVDTASNGHQALSAVAAKEPDVVVLDVGLPGVDGLAVCRRYRIGGPNVSDRSHNAQRRRMSVVTTSVSTRR